MRSVYLYSFQIDKAQAEEGRMNGKPLQWLKGGKDGQKVAEIQSIARGNPFVAQH